MNNHVEKPTNVEVTNIKEFPAAPKKQYQATPGKIITLIVALSVVGYGLYHLNKWFDTTTKSMIAKNNGKVPAGKLNTSDPVDYSCKLELYAADGKSGLFDILHKNKSVPQEYELVGYSTSKKLESNDDSFVSNFSARTSDDIELNGFDREESAYPAPRRATYGLQTLSRYFNGDKESLL